MNAANRVWLAGARARAMSRLRAVGPLLLIAVLIGVSAYLSGRSAGKRDERTRVVDSTRRVMADTIEKIEKRLAQRAPVIESATVAAKKAREEFRAAESAIKYVHDTTIVVGHDSVAVVPPVVITKCDNAIVKDSIDVHVVAAQLDDMTKDRNTWRDRALLDEKNAPKIPRLGFKSGVVVGAAAILFLVFTL